MDRRRAVEAEAPRITVVVATRERPRLLRICLNALLDLDYPDYEIVVVDNAPETAATARLVKQLYAPSVRYRREDRKDRRRRTTEAWKRRPVRSSLSSTTMSSSTGTGSAPLPRASVPTQMSAASPD